MPSLGDFIYAQFIFHPPKPTTSFQSKTIIITGANGGLGKETAKHLVSLEATKVILACRSISNGNKAKSEIESQLKSKCPPSVLEVWQLDLESPASVEAFVAKANALPRLDVFINNAGIHSSKFSTVYETERCIGVNVIGTFLLALQLIPKLRQTAREFNTTPHLTTVTSALYDSAKWPAETGGKDIFEWFREEKNFDWMNQYNISKLMQIYILMKLSALVDPLDSNTKGARPIVINSLDPCFCKTGLGSPEDLPRGMQLAGKIFTAAAARTAEEGSRLVVQAASAGRETHGKYMRTGKVQAYDKSALNKRRQEDLWKTLCVKVEGLQKGLVTVLPFLD
ncbi:hypothetical protein B0T16DRAFT_380711 [Cercophora newfieldiana]|uniref:Uncharacterized protein n=1 Tax=Cercophora newfieldiana TaxID=92897 RepID=A0AA40CKF9_9PEZI|nr:hypothetical protein B0T16DRAFT_380711 [Cercophora newfieldiana]